MPTGRYVFPAEVERLLSQTEQLVPRGGHGAVRYEILLLVLCGQVSNEMNCDELDDARFPQSLQS
jgi:hypothetical protein